MIISKTTKTLINRYIIKFYTNIFYIRINIEIKNIILNVINNNNSRIIKLINNNNKLKY